MIVLFITVRPYVSLYPGPLYVVEGSNVTLPVCQVTGHPTPVVTWSKSFGQLPQGRVQSSSSTLKIFYARKEDSGSYLCRALNILGSFVKQTLVIVVTLPKFIIKPPLMVKATVDGTLTLNCSATGDPRPVISWKRQGAQLPIGRSHSSGDALIIRNLKKEDTGNYTCVATSADVSKAYAVSNILVTHRGMCLL